MEFKIVREGLADAKADAAMGFAFEEKTGPPTWGEQWAGQTGGLSQEIAASKEFLAKHQSALLIHRPSELAAKRLVLAGCGTQDDLTQPRLKEAVGAARRRLGATRFETLAVRVPCLADPSWALRAVVEGIAGASDEPDAHKSAGQADRSPRTVLIVDGSGSDGEARAQLERATAIADGQRRARKLSNEPGNLLPPTELAARTQQLVADLPVTCEVLDAKRLRELRMGALLGVAQGSEQPPVMIVLRYRPESAESNGVHLGLVGKAVTFDTGGISIKPSADMHFMKHDMAGGAAMIGAMTAIARLRPRVPVTAIIPSVENMPGSRAQRPGDIVTARCGKTVEVLNTDAEGRLILADALTYAKELGCTRLVNAATLTGAIVVALGWTHTGMFGNNAEWSEAVHSASRAAGERMWPMPVGESYSRLLETSVADMANIGPRWGGACTAAAFLQNFAGDTPWVHLDIAGTAWHEKKPAFAPDGATGVGVSTMTELAMAL